MNQVKTTDEMISELSDDAKIVLIKMGIDWKNMTGNASSWVANELLVALLRVEHSWTINSLQKFSGCGRAGIEWGFMPKFKEYNLIIRDEEASGRFIHWKLSDVGREVLTIMLSSCTECGNTGVCSKCGGEGTPENADPCDHTVYTDCEECDANTCDKCNGTGYKKCMWCCGYSRDEDDKGKCTYCNIERTYRSLRINS
ncbi:MAG: hypothetical protein HOJ16_06385 [Candidatus Peribacter sp.]|nr:hypothetical protein [Candidatus Peribacter sp.]